MVVALAVALPLVLSAVFVVSAAAKLRSPDDLSGWAEIGVPSPLRTKALLRLHPWAELALGFALAFLGGIPGVIAGFVGTGVMAVYLWLVARVRGASEDASCSCFGSRRPVTALTVVRNSWLLGVAVAATAVIWANPIWGGAVLAGTQNLGWVVGFAVAALTVAVILWPDRPEESVTPNVPGVPGAEGDDQLDYVRTRTPAVPVTLADGTAANLRDLTSRRPMLLLAVSEFCGACVAVIESAPRWREMLPEVDVRLMTTMPPQESRLTDLTEPQSLHDPHNYVRGSIGEWATPAAVLLGADGLLAGGPVSGDREVNAFVEDIHESLRAMRHTLR